MRITFFNADLSSMRTMILNDLGIRAPNIVHRASWLLLNPPIMMAF